MCARVFEPFFGSTFEIFAQSRISSSEQFLKEQTPSFYNLKKASDFQYFRFAQASQNQP
jgi:hypothetical protein